jgi:hypothetical protein
VRAFLSNDSSDFSNESQSSTYPEETTEPETPPTSPIEPDTPPTPNIPPTKPETPPTLPIPPTTPIATQTEEESTFQTITQGIKDSFLINMETPLVQNTSTALEIIGLTTGVAAASAATSIPLLSITPISLAEIVTNFLRIFGFLGRSAKKKNETGFVFDQETKRPIPGAIISIVSDQGITVATTTTDFQGRYGFLAKDGLYTLQVSKKGYTLKQDNPNDEFYGTLYTGQTINVSQNQPVITSIAMQNNDINWQDFAQRKIDAYTSIFGIFKKYSFLILFYLGFAASLASTYHNPTKLSFAITIAYILIAIWKIFFKTTNYGVITNKENKPVPFSMISLYGKDNPNQRIAFTVSDVLGRYTMLVKDGFYTLKIKGSQLGGNPFSKEVQVYAEKGIVRENVMVG